jgi:hypothetical protein
MPLKVPYTTTPEEFKVIDKAIRAAVTEQLDRYAHIAMNVVPTHSAVLPDYEQLTARKAVRYTLEIAIEIDITDVPLTFNVDK